jgi:hypothetical protein
VLLGSFQQILGYFIFSAVVFLGLTVAGLFMLRERRGRGAVDVVMTSGISRDSGGVFAVSRLAAGVIADARVARTLVGGSGRASGMAGLCCIEAKCMSETL